MPAQTRLHGLKNAATNRGGIVLRCNSASLFANVCRISATRLRSTEAGSPMWKSKSERPCDLVGEEPAERAARGIDLTDEFGLVPAERDSVVAVPRAGQPAGACAAILAESLRDRRCRRA